MRNIQFTPDAFEQYTEWQTSNKTIYNKLNKLIINQHVLHLRVLASLKP